MLEAVVVPCRNDNSLDTKTNGKVASHSFSESVLGPGMGMAGPGTRRCPLPWQALAAVKGRILLVYELDFCWDTSLVCGE